MDIAAAKNYVALVDLTGTWRNPAPMALGAAEEAGSVFDQSKVQAQIVGSGIFSFAKGVDDAAREAISNSVLLAQLVANKTASVATDPMAWFAEYVKVLQNVGWALQDFAFQDYTNQGTAAEVNEHILEVMSVVLGPAPAALAIMTATMTALKAMQPNSPWITIFSRESQKATISRFQIGLIERGENDSVVVSLLACLIEATNTVTQVLLFKFRDANARFKATGGKVAIDLGGVMTLGPAIRARVRAYQADYVSGITDLPVPLA